ncbi:hypothetical protein C8R42DRAFT_644169 [Lentinula raphanica]|nr:hypothetical protein C8R42DRAFT_644169 [Lentinula raphanica]
MSSGGTGVSVDSMRPFYLKSEPQASLTLRYLANSLNSAAFDSFCHPHSDAHPPPYIGFDLEWKPNFRPGQPENPIAVVQIAYGTASYVVHVKWMQYLPDGLAEILENPRIVKVGVGIQNDAKKLYKDLGVCLNSCVDLSLFVKCVDSGLFAGRLERYADVPPQSSFPSKLPTLPSDCQKPREFYGSEAFLGPYFKRLFRGPYTSSIGLARLAEVYEGLVLTKGKITRSNWDLELTPAQLTYAALDAYAGSIVYSHLTRLFHLLDPSRRPKRQFYAFDCIRGALYHCCGNTRRTLLGEQMEDSELPHFGNGYVLRPTFHPVEEEIMLHLQGVGSDQLSGLVPWSCSNPEYDPGPMPPKKSPEEQEMLRRERQKKRDLKRIEERGQNEKDDDPQIGNHNANTSKVAAPAGFVNRTSAGRPAVGSASKQLPSLAARLAQTSLSTVDSIRLGGLTFEQPTRRIYNGPLPSRTSTSTSTMGPSQSSTPVPNSQNRGGSNNQASRGRRRPRKKNPPVLTS